MITFFAIVLVIIFTSIATIHFYWAFGGKKWANLAIPTQPNATQTLLFKPRFVETVIVASGFLVFIWLIGMKVRWFPLIWLSKTSLTYIVFGIAFIFFIRAIGEFRYIGFFKSIQKTPFGQMDTRYYSPLCLLIAIITLIINL
jgi:hypothetical protein